MEIVLRAFAPLSCRLVQGQALIGERFAELISKIAPNAPSTGA